MSHWVRLWEDMPTDPKWIVVRSRALQSVTSVTIGDIVSVFVCMLTNADRNGDLVNWCDEDIAAALGFETHKVTAIRDAMQGKTLDGNHLKGWNKRQPKREDNSAGRVRALRTRRNDSKHIVTHRNAPDKKRIETEKIEKPKPSVLSKKTKSRSSISEDERPVEADLEFAQKTGMDSRRIDLEWAQFCDHHRKLGNAMADWRAAWRTWVRNAVKWQSTGDGRPQHPPPKVPGQNRLRTASGLWVDNQFYPD